MAREDLYWTVKQPGLSWARQPLSREMIDGVFGPRFDAHQATPYEIEAWTTERIVRARPARPGVLFASAGTAVGEIEFAESGKYGIGIRARGTPCRGRLPDCRVVASTANRSGPCSWTAASGRRRRVRACGTGTAHQVTVAFVNDASDPPQEDRNLEVDQVLVVRDRRADDTVLPDRSGRGRGRKAVAQGRVVFDRLRWDTEAAQRPQGRSLCLLAADRFGGRFHASVRP